MLTRDEADIVEVLKAGLVDAEAIASYLSLHVPMVLGRFQRARTTADAENELER